jgi:hypothetical protein
VHTGCDPLWRSVEFVSSGFTPHIRNNPLCTLRPILKVERSVFALVFQGSEPRFSIQVSGVRVHAWRSAFGSEHFQGVVILDNFTSKRAGR